VNTPSEVTENDVGLGESCHPACVACGDPKRGGLGLRFVRQDDGSVTASFSCEERYQGFPDRLHGGIIALLLDAAMIHCLFARGHHAVTTKLSVQFRHPVVVGEAATVRGWHVGESPSRFVVKAEIRQSGLVKAVAEGIFARQEVPLSDEGSRR